MYHNFVIFNFFHQGNRGEGTAFSWLFVALSNGRHRSEGMAKTTNCLQVVETRLHRTSSYGHNSVLEASIGSAGIRDGWVNEQLVLIIYKLVLIRFCFKYSEINGVIVCFKLGNCTHREPPGVPPTQTQHMQQLEDAMHYVNVNSKPFKPVSIEYLKFSSIYQIYIKQHFVISFYLYG